MLKTLSAQLLTFCFSKNVRAAALRVLSVGQTGRKRIWKAALLWQVLYFFYKLLIARSYVFMDLLKDVRSFIDSEVQGVKEEHGSCPPKLPVAVRVPV